MMKALLLSMLCVAACTAQKHNMVIFGDSWGSYGKAAFEQMLQEQTAGKITVLNKAEPGTTAQQWNTAGKKRVMKNALHPGVRVVWLTLMGNDMQAFLPNCARQRKSPKQCADEGEKLVTPHMNSIISYIKSVAPQAEIVGFGYDILALDKRGCARFKQIFPGCNGRTQCINIHMTRTQQIWESFAERHSNVKSVNLLGSLQFHGNVRGAAIGKPVMSQYTPGNLYQDCIHPNFRGFKLIFKDLYNLYLNKFTVPAVKTPAPTRDPNAPPATPTPVPVGLPVGAIVSLRVTGGGRYITAEQGGQRDLTVRSAVVKEWEMFLVEAHPQGGYAFKALSTNNYVQVNNRNADAVLRAIGGAKQSWERFTVKVTGRNTVAIQSAHSGKWLRTATVQTGSWWRRSTRTVIKANGNDASFVFEWRREQ